MSSFTTIAIALAVIVFLMIKRIAGGPVQGSRMAIVPVVLIAVGLSDIAPHHRPHDAMTAGDIRYLVLAGLVSLALGLARGLSVRLSVRDGAPYQRYGGLTVVLWLVTVAVRIGLDVTASSLGATGTIASKSLLLMFGISLAGESLAVLARLVMRGQLTVNGPRAGAGYQGFDDRYTGRH